MAFIEWLTERWRGSQANEIDQFVSQDRVFQDTWKTIVGKSDELSTDFATMRDTELEDVGFSAPYMLIIKRIPSSIDTAKQRIQALINVQSQEHAINGTLTNDSVVSASSSSSSGAPEIPLSSAVNALTSHAQLHSLFGANYWNKLEEEIFKIYREFKFWGKNNFENVFTRQTDASEILWHVAAMKIDSAYTFLTTLGVYIESLVSSETFATEKDHHYKDLMVKRVDALTESSARTLYINAHSFNSDVKKILGFV